jgi:16S rRNA (cytosine967-C5)-methyltransferase
MTPAARLSAAIGVLDRWLSGTPAEQALTNWGRASRFAGSGDRAAVRDLVFDAIRCRDSFAHRGGGLTGRGLILGGLRTSGTDPAALFTGEGHAPACLTAAETDPGPATGLAALDCPAWLAPDLQASLGGDFAAVMQALRSRAPVFLRVNTARIDLPAAQAMLAADGIATRPHPLARTALEVTGNARKIQNADAYLRGLVELQDAASQAVALACPLRDGDRVLDLCAGGGGKTLALAAQARITAFAHDVDAGRMRDLPARAARAGATITRTDSPESQAPYDLVLVDAPCSGSGSWRRAPEGKWRLTPERLAALVQVQAGLLDRAAAMVTLSGHLAYATCALLEAENGAQVDAFLRRTPGWRALSQRRLTPLDGGDGFFVAILARVG